MRVTKELEAKIDKKFKELYEKRFDELYAEKERCIENVKDAVCEEVNKLALASPILWTFIANQIYGDMSLERIRYHVFNRNNINYDLLEMEELSKVNKKIEALKEEKKQAIADLKIEIAYSKDLGSIKKVFSNFNLTF